MAAPGFDIGTPQAPAPKKSNTVLWIVLAALGGGTCLCVPILAAILFPVFSQARVAAAAAACRSNMEMTGEAILAYAEANNGVLPKAQGWTEAVRKYAPQQDGPMGCPGIRPTSAFGAGYALNPEHAGKKLEAITGNLRKQPLLTEANDVSPGSLMDENWRMTHRHGSGRAYTVYFLDKGAVIERPFSDRTE